MTLPDVSAGRAIEAWLQSKEARRITDVQLVTELAERLNAIVPVKRLSLSVRTMHPEVYVRNLIWQREQGTELFIRLHDITAQSMYRASPIPQIHAGKEQIRVRLDPDAELEYPVCRELREQGATDYVVYCLPLYEQTNSFVSFVTWAPGGFSDEHLATLRSLLLPLSMRVALYSVLHAARSLLKTYLGPEASAHVLRGDFRRGGGEMIDAVVLTCDMRGFTAMVDRDPIDDVIALLDRYFEIVAEPIEAQGGEILKLIGDAVLAVFPLAGGNDTCARALRAAEGALEAVTALATPSGAPIRIGVGLHVGEVLYGNIGARGRLDFTVIGRAVNEVCRVEAKCKELGQDLLLTGPFVERLGHAEVVSVGRHTLRGVSEPTELFTIKRSSSTLSR